ncbi:MAG: N-acetylmuramoyl-L-alanine amidase [Eubacterium sp.]
MSKIVCLDAGHYKNYNQYPPYKKYYEGNQMWLLANLLKEKLEKRGIKVVMTKNSLEHNPSLTSRGATAGKNGANIFVSLHSNAVSNSVNNSVTGVECYYSIFDEKGKAFASNLCNAVSSCMETKNRGAKTRKGSGNWDYYSVIKGAVDSGCKQAFLIEHGFHTSTKDASFLIDTANLDKLAETECKVICAWLGVEYNTQQPTQQSGFRVRIVDSALNIRSGPGTSYKVVGCIRDKGVYTIVETRGAVGYAGSWGKLKSGAGWISLNSCFAKKL